MKTVTVKGWELRDGDVWVHVVGRVHVIRNVRTVGTDVFFDVAGVAELLVVLADQDVTIAAREEAPQPQLTTLRVVRGPGDDHLSPRGEG